MIKALDHYMFKTRSGDIGVVVGNTHSSGFLIGYVKYRLSSGESIWSDRHYGYERVVKRYDTAEITGSTPWRQYIPCYNYHTPVIPVSEIKTLYNPVERAEELINTVRDELELNASKLLEALYSCGSITSLGITGSLLPRIHSVAYSDVDLVVYGLRDSLEIVECVAENPDLFKEFDQALLDQWAVRVASVNNLSKREAIYYYRSWRRGIFNGREYSIIYNDGVYRSIDNCEQWVSEGFIEAEIVFSGGLEGLNYPSKGFVETWRYLSGETPCSDIEYALSFEALYIPLLFEGGRALVRGLLQRQPLSGRYRVLVGVSEGLTYIKPLEA